MKIIIFELILSTAQCQYQIVRINPFKQLAQTLVTHRVMEQDGGAISLHCSGGTKVALTLINMDGIFNISLQISITSAHYGTASTGESSHCSIKTFLHSVEATCQTQSNCTIGLLSESFLPENGNPCKNKK